MARGKKTRKCQWCGVDDTLMEDMKFEMKGIKAPKKAFYHEHCYGEYRIKQDFLDKEKAEKDELTEVIKEIYGIKGDLHRQAFPLLESIRNGQPINGKETNKRYKEGYEYHLIRKTFEYCTDTIEWANANKNFDGFMQAFRYALSVILDKIYVVEQREKERQRQEMRIEKHFEDIQLDENNFELEYETNFKKKDKKSDITSFLD